MNDESIDRLISLTPLQKQILLTLAQYPNITHRDLADKTKSSKAMVTKTLTQYKALANKLMLIIKR